jgi:hypothetical protein
VLSVLKGVRRLALKIRLDQELSVRMLTEMPSVSEAEKMANGYNALLLLGAYNKKGRDEEVIFKSTKITTEARQIVLTFNLPRAAAGEWFSRLIRKHGTPATLPQD